MKRITPFLCRRKRCRLGHHFRYAGAADIDFPDMAGSYSISLPELEQMAGRIALVFAAWGILAFASQSDPNAGGSFGLGIIGAQDFLGALRIFGFLLLSICFIAPACLSG